MSIPFLSFEESRPNLSCCSKSTLRVSVASAKRTRRVRVSAGEASRSNLSFCSKSTLRVNPVRGEESRSNLSCCSKSTLRVSVASAKRTRRVKVSAGEFRGFRHPFEILPHAKNALGRRPWGSEVVKKYQIRIIKDNIK